MGVRLVLQVTQVGAPGAVPVTQPGQGWETTPPEWELLSQLGVMISEVELS